jgi:hypothetical protein
MLVVAIAILAGVVAVASGRGGELAPEYPDYPPLELGPVTAADVALLRPPSAAWGYNMRVTDEALEIIAKAVTERDVKISALQQEVSDLRKELARGWPRGPVPPGTAVRGDPAAIAGGERTDEGGEQPEPQRTEPPWAESEWVPPPWTGPETGEPETGEPGAAEPHWPGPGMAEPETGAHGAALAGELPHQAPFYEEPLYEEPAFQAPSHEDPSYVEPAPESSHEGPSPQESSHEGPAHGGVRYSAWDDSGDEADWDESQQTLVWGTAHQQAKASRLQEQTQPSQAEDTPPEGAPAVVAPPEGTGSQDPRGEDTTSPAPAGHRAEVTARAHYDEARRPAQAEQDRE